MTMVDTYIKNHTGEDWSDTLRFPLMFFAVFEMIIVGLILLSDGGRLHTALEEHGTYHSLIGAILAGSTGVIIGSLTKRVRLSCKYHVTSTSQLINAVGWGVAGFVLLDTTDESALAVGVLGLSVVNIFLAIVDEGWGSKRISSAEG